MLKYKGFNITFDDKKESDTLQVDKIKQKYDLVDVNIKRQYKKIKKKESELTLNQQRAVEYLYQHLYIYPNEK